MYRQPFKRFIKQEGKQSGETAITILKEEVENYTEEVVEKAAEFAEHADRKTVQDKDVKKAIETVREKR